MRSQMLRKGLRFVACFAFLAFLFLPVISFAQGTATSTVNPNDTFGITQVNNSIGLVSTDIRVIVGRVIQIILSLLGAIAIGLIIYAGFTIMTANGSEDKVGEGKKILVNATVGLIILLSAVGIVQFVLNALSQATGISNNNGDDTALTSGQDPKQTFAGTASKGTIIKDHYPERDQKEVPRNTKISVTFRDPFLASSTIQNTNNTCWGADGKPIVCVDGLEPYFGDCNFDKVPFSWEKDCDQLITTSVEVYKKADAKKTLTKAAILASYDKDKKMYAFTLKPHSLLGDEKADEWYVVAFTNNFKKDEIKQDNKTYPGMFDGQLSPYKWEFQTSVNADFLPPQVMSVYPSSSSTAYRNTIVQIQFSEAVDPTIVAGLAGPSTPYFSAIFNSKDVAGEWRLSNGYKTLEFVSNQPCGQNSCGETMYCLPVTCDPNNASCTVPYEILLRTGELLTPGSTFFEGKPGSGIMDMAGNTLDGNANGTPNGRPVLNLKDMQAIKTMINSDKEGAFDNYWWKFSVKNTIDLSVPHIRQVTPGLDAEGVNGTAPVTLEFSKMIMSDSMYNGAVMIHEEQAKAGAAKIDFWVDHSMKTLDGEKSMIGLNHREFGPGGIDMHYFVTVSSSLKSVNQNCFYPGVGPVSTIKGDSPVCADPKNPATCVQVNLNATTDTGCVVTDGSIPVTQGDVATCLAKMKALIK